MFGIYRDLIPLNEHVTAYKQLAADKSTQSVSFKHEKKVQRKYENNRIQGRKETPCAKKPHFHVIHYRIRPFTSR